MDSSGNIYIADTTNNRIRYVAASTGIVTTFAGNGTAGYSGDGSAATIAEKAAPMTWRSTAPGIFYIVDENNNRIREVTATTGIIVTVAGNGTAGLFGRQRVGHQR